MDQKLGRGLSDLLDIVEGRGSKSGYQKVFFVDINSIRTRKDQPRKNFNLTELSELANSIREHGILQPLIVKKNYGDDDVYDLIAGERRLRASRQAGLAEVPVHLIDCSERDVYAIALIENVQRSQLNPIEEAMAIQTLINEHNCTQENLAKMISKSRSYISNALRLLTLSDDIKEKIAIGDISIGHAKILAGRLDSSDLAKEITSEGLSVRDLEHIVRSKKMDMETHDYDGYASHEDPDVLELSERIMKSIGMYTKLKLTKHGAVVTIVCKTRSELESLATALIDIGDDGSADKSS